ncbi:unnamed protein product [Hymenolepis diminuta]|uniref:SH3 domain-containing protein n=1 Tax=Hymenolepis diminuta TaxID=6216 RepID=A0A0R3SN46_HYMDI|nr:unnamed protein product [Hymenolepis diminuta]
MLYRTNRRFQSEVRSQTSGGDQRPFSSTPLRQTSIASAGDGCVFFISLYDYDPATMSPNPGAVDDELPFREGDIIKVHLLNRFKLLLVSTKISNSKSIQKANSAQQSQRIITGFKVTLILPIWPLY